MLIITIFVGFDDDAYSHNTNNISELLPNGMATCATEEMGETMFPCICSVFFNFKVCKFYLYTYVKTFHLEP
jgi:hypothetical protein